MKKILMLLLLPLAVCSQKIERAHFDPMDSVFTVESREETLSGSPNFGRKKYLAVRCVRHEFEYLSVSTDTNKLSVFFKFVATAVTAFDESSSIKIMFDDNSVTTYPNAVGYHIYFTGGMAWFVLNVQEDDQLLSRGIKMVKIASSNDHNEFYIPAKNQDVVKNCLSLIANYKQ